MSEESGKRGSEPDLELPSLLGFRRRKRKAKEAAESAEVPADETADETPAPVTEEAPVVHEDTQPIAVVAPPPAVSEPPGDEQPDEQPPAEPEPQPEPVPDPQPEPVAAWQEPERGPEPAVEQTAVISPAPIQPAPIQQAPVQQAPVQQADAPPLFVDEQEPAGHEVATEEEYDEEPAARERTPLTLPTVNPRVAVAISGLLVGLVGVALTIIAGRGCETVRGVGSCGGIGLVALLVVLAIEVVLGSILLRAWRITDPTSTSFLGVGLVAVVALLFFLSSLESVWMFVVVPVLTAVMFLVSWWVTETFVEGSTDSEMHR